MITFDEIIEEREYRERIVKFFQLPIRLSVSKEKFISDLEFMKEVDCEKYSKMVEYVVSDFNEIAKEQETNKPDFSMEEILVPLLEKIESNEAWLKFMEEDNSDVLSTYKGITNIHGFYKEENDGKFFLSIDLETANWQSLQRILGIQESYEGTIANYTDNLIPPISKTFRAKVTSKLGAKEIMFYNKKILNENRNGIIELINKRLGINLSNDEPFAFYADEFIIEIDKTTLKTLQNSNLIEMKRIVEDKLGIKVHIRPFELRWLDVNKSCAKIYKDHYEIINLSRDVLMLMLKTIVGAEAEEIDFEKVNLDGMTKNEYIEKLKKAINNKIELEDVV